MWLRVNNIEELQEGDVIELGTTYPLIKHYAVVVIQDGEKKVAHYPYPDSPCIEDINYVINNRPERHRFVKRIFRTGVPSDQIIDKHNEIQNIDKKYKFIRFTCENYVRALTGSDIGIDQRFLIGGGLIIIILLLILIFKGN